MHRIDTVIERSLCSGCGACAFIAGDRGVTMAEVPAVGKRPVGVKALPLFVKDQIADVCPGSQVSAPSWGSHVPDTEEVLVGPAVGIWEGWATDPAIRFAGSSGGVVTALASYAIEKLGMAFVVHTGMDPQRPWRNRTVVSRDRRALLDNAGSRYTTSSPVEALRLIEDSDRPCVFIGKPCDVAAVTALRKSRPRLDQNLGLVLSFFCAGTPASEGSRALATQLGFGNSEEITDMRYRGRGWPGDFAVSDGKRRASIPYDEAWGRLARSPRQLRCHLCPDGLGELADVTSGDAWHRREEGTDGISLILARTERGNKVLQAALRDHYLEATISSHARVVAAQGLVRRRRLIQTRLIGLRSLLLPTPSFPGFRLGSAARQIRMRDHLKEYLRTIRRAVRHRLFQQEPRE